MLTTILVLTLLSSIPQAAPDVIVADFEGMDYGAWTTKGEAFGSGPAQGTLPNQMPVSGYQGHGLVNSYRHGDGTTGALTSPEFALNRRFLNFLMGGGNHPGECCMNLLVAGKVVRTATGRNSEHLDWRTWELADLRNKPARIEIVDKHSGGWGHINVDQITLSDKRMAEDVKTSPLFQETWRPQFHVTAQRGWLNDPNGLVYYAGEYHMFFQHNPSGTEWGNMTWGHAVSRDLVHWKQLPNAIAPDRLGTIFSGSAVVDWNNTSGFKTGKEPPLVAIYTAAGGTSPESKGQPFTQCVAYSNDRGRTWTKYAANPVLPNAVGENRDPKVVWHAPTRRWVMALYLEKNDYALFNSPDLKHWTLLHRLTMPGCSECPDFFEMPVLDEVERPSTSTSTSTNRSANSEIRNPKSKITKWVFTAANGKYFVGDFDGARFTPDPGGPQQVEYGANCYAVQTYSDLKDGRRIQIAWMQGGTYPEMPFNQQMSVPCELTLRHSAKGLRLCKKPVREIDRLSLGHFSMEIAALGPDRIPGSTEGKLWHVGPHFDLRASIELGAAMEIRIEVKGEQVVYSVPEKQLTALGRSAPLEPIHGRIMLQMLVDRTCLEVFGNGGQVALSSCFLAKRTHSDPTLTVTGGRTGRVKLVAYPLQSIWPETSGDRAK